MSHTKIVNIDFTAPESGQRYTGQFIIKRFSVRDHSKISVRKTQLNGGLHVLPNGVGIDEETDAFNYFLAALEVGIIKAPDWWNLEEVYDFSLIRELHREVADFQATFRPNRGENSNASGAGASVQEGSSAKAQEANRPGSATKMVGHEVQYTLDP